MRPTRYPSRARALLCEGFPSLLPAFLLSREQVCNLVFCIALSGALLRSGPWVGAFLYAVCFLGCALWL